MKKYLALLAFIGFTSCSALNEPEPNAPIAESYFFPESNGLQYTYSHDDHNTSDTSTYYVVVGQNYGSFSRLERYENGAIVDGDPFYYYKTATSRDGISQCLLSKDGMAENIIALQGELTVGSSWAANDDGSIVATVQDHYDFYYLVGREKKYDDVVVVKYVDSREESGTYILRYFANGYGLIHEKRIIGNEADPSAEVSNLRLLELKTPNSIVPRTPDHWWDAHARFGIAPNLTPFEND